MRLNLGQQHTLLRNNFVIHRLQRHAGLRSITYLAGAAVLLNTGYRLYDPNSFWTPYATAVTIAPVGYAWTYAFVTLRNEDKVAWSHVLRRQNIIDAGTGIALGTSAFLLIVGVAAAKGWARLPEWGWEQDPSLAVVRSLLLLAVGQVTLAWNEEVVFRGYGLQSASSAISCPGAAVGITVLDAWAHGSDPSTLVGQSAIALVLLILRLQSGALWMSVGYHFAWNYMQTAIFGPPNKLPSLRPLHVTGSTLWLGRPGYPEPGILSTLVHVGIAVIATWVWWSRSKKL